MKKIFSAISFAAMLMVSASAVAADALAPPKIKWPHHGVTGTYDRAALQRGFQVYKEVCAACHAMKYLSYRDLAGLGYNPEEIKSIAAEYTVTDGPNDDGEMFERAARPSDRFKSPFNNDKAARAANGGALPPDLSLVVKARHYGEDYIQGLLTGYEEPPAGTTVMTGMYWNKYFPGHQMAMAPPLTEGQVSYADGTTSSVEQMSKDVTQFLAWASEPHMEARKRIGIKVVLFLLAFAGIMYAAKRKVWKDVH
jgi:ubiquinol-cytochrome c reductase cytochrome c1 subunit